MQKYSTRPEGNDAGKQNLSSREQSVSLHGPSPLCTLMTGKEFHRFPFPKKFNLFENQGLLFSAKWSIIDLGKLFA